jgi:hypothetical protein
MKNLVRCLWFSFAVLATPLSAQNASIRPRDEAIVILITDKEAALASGKKAAIALASSDGADNRAITRNPKIFLVSPAAAVASESLIHFEVEFQAFNGAQIEPRLVKVTYLTQSRIDLTPRVAAFIRSDGIDIPRAQAARGKHLIRIDVADTEGREASTQLVLDVTQ